MHAYAFEKLQVWQEARSLTVSMYHLTAHFPPFYQMAYSSAIELLNQLIISFDLGYVTSEQLNESRLKIETISNKINSLRNSVFTSTTQPLIIVALND